jgi:RHS repeat-associated protein
VLSFQREDEDARGPSADESDSVGKSSAASREPPDGKSGDSRDRLNIPKIELPKGGGALKPIDEKFKANAADGTVSLSMSLPLSKSRSDFGPALSLDYSSGGGNGPFGLGWNLTQAAIQRRTDKRLPEYRDADESDVFILSGQEDLVPALLDDGSGNPDAFTAPTGEAVKRYRPRIEGAFARIERITPPNSVVSYWKTTSKDNVATIFGRSPSARIADPADPGGQTRVFKWLPELSYDDKGNCIEYFYLPEDFSNVADTLHERNRLNGIAPCTNTYLKRARYGNKAPYYPDPSHPYDPAPPGTPGYFFELVLDYGDHDADAPTAAVQNLWACRLDPFSQYKSGFDIRTYRLCRRVLLFHTFKELNDGVNPAPTQVRSLDVDYRYFANPAATPAELANMEVDYPVAMRQTGWVKTGASSYDRKSLPAAKFTYQELGWNKDVQAVSPAGVENTPAGLSKGYQFVDLWSEGISGILAEQGGAWFYKSNLGGGRFTPAQAVSPKPSFTGLAGGTLQLIDLEADGRKFIVASQPPVRGALALSDAGEWQPFKAFRRVPNLKPSDPNVKFIDLDGDGRADIAVSEDSVFTWYPSAGTEGYDGPRRAPKPYDEERGPALVFADPTGSIFLANMSGSGLTDIVRIRNGEVCYWPNLGYGHFGAKVTMGASPLFDTPDLFDPQYIHLADVSGTGASDILYLGKNRFRAWLNRSGNTWSDPVDIDPFADTERPNEIQAADFLGNGTACIVWSSPLPRYAPTPMRFVDLMGGRKPYLLAGYDNQCGKTVALEYKSSTWFYLADKQAGKPWVTKLPFPVHCLTKMTSRDAVTGASLVTQYVYHHGYYDHAEREYRGFACVEQTDSESFDNFVKGGSGIVDLPLDQAPVLTRTWFHTGAFFHEKAIEARLRSEYFQNPDFAEYHLPPPLVLAAAAVQDQREAQRACKGMIIRQEVYGLDNIAGVSTVPYSAAERNWLVQSVQPAASNRHAVFLVTETESITYNYERIAKDPRIAHTLNTAIDGYGNVLESASVAYARQPGAPPVPPRVQTEQQKRTITYSVNGYTKDVINDAAYRLRRLCETSSFELTGVTPAAACFTLKEIHDAFAGAAAIGYEVVPDGSSQKRALKHSRTLFLKDDTSAALPLGEIEALALPYETFRLAFTAPIVTALYGTRVTAAFLAESGYALSDDMKTSGLFPASDDNGQWWAHDGHAQYPASAANFFYMPSGYLDPFAKLTTVAYYADYQLVVQAVTDAVGNTNSVDAFDFRTIRPRLVKDANANLSEAAIDALGFVTGTAQRGKGSEADDLIGFAADLSAADAANFFADPVTNGPALLQHATSRFVYDFTVVPVRVASIRRETHYQTTVATGTPSKLQYRFEYSDGFGNLAMVKAQAEPGIALALDGSNNVIQVDTTPNLRWIGNGRTVLNNKGKPVKQYEPYFSVSYGYEDDPKLVEIGVTPLMRYDPPGRNVRTDYPDGTFAKTDIQGWTTQAFDRNDTVNDSGWYADRTTGVLAGDARENAAAQKAAVHYNTPAVSHHDVQGRAFYAIAHNRFVDHATAALTDELYETDTQLDVEGNARQIVDPRGNAAVAYDYDMLGVQAHSASMDAGERWVLNDGAGHAVYAFDGKKQTLHTSFDEIRRPIQTTLTKGAALPTVVDRITYGEGQPSDQAKNLRGKLFEHRDQAGILTNPAYDFKGNTLETTRVLTAHYQDDVDWNAPPLMQTEVFKTQSEYDALGRPTRVVAPNSNPATANVLLPSYNEAGLLQAVSGQLRGSATTTAFVTNIDYNEKGQRARIDYANGASTVHKYDPLTFRLRGLVTARNADPEIFWDDESKIGQPAYANDVLQFLSYVFDPVGNITSVADDAQQTIYFSNKRVEPSCEFTYDAVYRLTDSTGREHIGGKTAPGPFDDARMGNPNPGDGNQLQTFALQYDYDKAGNMVLMKNPGNWNMAFTYAGTSNQMQTAVANGAPGTPFPYTYDEHGNITAMPHLTTMEWDFANRLRHTTVSAGPGPASQESWYAYDAGGQRVRKVVVKGNLVEERFYFSGIEIYRRTRAGTLELERESLLVTDDKRRIALVDTPTVLPAGSKETPLTRFQYANHLDTACLELDGAAQIISYEEYYPFGSTSYQGTDQSREIPAKRYRYIGKERDDDSGFSYCGARYYAPWLVRWISPDPVGVTDGPNLYAYCRDNPVILHDTSGTQGDACGVDDEDQQVCREVPCPAMSVEPPALCTAPPAAKAAAGKAAGAAPAVPAAKPAAPPEKPDTPEDPADIGAPPDESAADHVKRREELQRSAEATRLELKKLESEVKNLELIAAAKNRLRVPVIDPDTIPEDVTLGIDLQTGGSAVGLGTKDRKGSFDAYQITILPRNAELFNLYYSKKNSWDIALFKEPGLQYSRQLQPGDTGKLEEHNTLGASVDVFNLTKGRGEVAITTGLGYDFNSKNLAGTFVLGGKFTLFKNLNIPIIGRFGTNQLRLYGGVGIELDKSFDPKQHSGFGGVPAGGGVLFEINPFEKRE